MIKVWRVVLASVFMIMAAPAIASDAANKVVDQARKDCKSFENGILKTTKQTITLTDLTGDGRPEEIVDASQFSCSTAASLFCGTGGCSITIIVNGKPFDFLAKGWKIVKWSDRPILLFAIHGSACGGTNLRRCYQAVVWSEGGFRSIGGR
jgi:hypothetical protein